MSTPPVETPPPAQPPSGGRLATLKKLSRPVLTVLLSLLALFVGVSVFMSLASLKEEPPRRRVGLRTFNVTVFDAQPTDFIEVVTGFGTARADRSVDISSEVSGLVIEVHPDLKVGTRVSGPEPTFSDDGKQSLRPRGELLLRLGSGTFDQQVTRLQQQVAQLRTQVDQLKAEEKNERRLIETQERNLQSAEDELASKRRSRAAGAGSATSVRQAEQTVNQYEESLVRTRNQLTLVETREAQLEAQIAAAEAELESANLDVGRTAIRPPFTGVLSAVNVEEGQYVRPGDPLVSLTDLDTIEVPVSLTQSQYARLDPLLKEGQTPAVALAVNETDDAIWSGRLVRAAPVADETTRTVAVYVEVDNTMQPSPLLPGTFVHARIDGPRIDDALVLPRDAIIRGEIFVASRDVIDAVRRRDAILQTESEDDEEIELRIAELDEEIVAKLRAAAKRRVTVDRTLESFAFIEDGVTPGDRVVMTNLDIIYDDALIVEQEVVSPTDELRRSRVIALKPADQADE